MGSYSSKQPVKSKVRDTKNLEMSEKVIIGQEIANNFDLSSELRGLQLDKIDADKIDDINPISLDVLDSWEQEFVSDDKNLLAQQALGTSEIVKIVANKKAIKSDQYLFNTTVDIIGADTFYNNQKSSGRCWIFATANVLRSHVIRSYNLDADKFQLSQSYLFFYDKLEKANLFLENVIATADLEIDDLYLMHIFKEPLSDGGQWDMIVNLLNKYGAVPVEHFPDNAQAMSSSKLNYILFEKLREYGLILRKLIKSDPKSVKIVKHSMVKQIYQIISLALGTPPKPNTKFTWEFIDKEKKFKYFETTPLKFYKDHIKFVAQDHFSLIHDPRNKFDHLYTVDKLNNIYGGKPIEYVNLDLPEIKQVAIKMLKANEPIFFGSDVGKFNDSKTGILDTQAYDYKLAFNTDFKISKAERLRTGSSQMTHAMVITGVHLDPNGNPVRWKIQNSWGEEVGEKGTFMMTDSWFDEYVFQIVTNKNFVSKKVYDIFKGKDYTVFPIYDPMGSLA
jgi:bleomycin hydrolase